MSCDTPSDRNSCAGHDGDAPIDASCRCATAYRHTSGSSVWMGSTKLSSDVWCAMLWILLVTSSYGSAAAAASPRPARSARAAASSCVCSIRLRHVAAIVVGLR